MGKEEASLGGKNGGGGTFTTAVLGENKGHFDLAVERLQWWKGKR